MIARAFSLRNLPFWFLGVIAALALLMPARSSAASDYGPWYPSPESTSKPYSAAVDPMNEDNETEMYSDLTCVLEDGSTFSDDEKTVLTNIIGNAALVYTGNYEWREVPDDLEDYPAKATANNGGFRDGKAGMSDFLEFQKEELLEKKRWVPTGDSGANGVLGNMDIDANQDESHYSEHANDGSDGTPVARFLGRPVGGERDYINVDIDEANVDDWEDVDQRAMAKFLNYDARNPLELYEEIPQGCAIGGFDSEVSFSFGDFFDEPADFVAGLLVSLPNDITDQIYQSAYPWALKFTFWTPHSERGDTFLNISFSCAPEDNLLRNISKSDIRQQCQSGEPLGFDKRRAKAGGERAWYLNLAYFFQWLVSGFYMLVIAIAAVLYMVRGNASTQLNVMKVVPRVFVSAIITIFAPFLIGALISASNFFVLSIFSLDDRDSIGYINSVLSNSGSASGAVEFFQIFINSVTGVLTAIATLSLALYAILRQMVLIALVIFAPVAAFCLIVDAWRPHFLRYVRALLLVVALPPACALLLKLALSINPLVAAPNSTFGTTLGLLGVLMVVATLWATSRMVKTGVAAAYNSKSMGQNFAGLAAGAAAGRLRPSSDATGMVAAMRRMGAGALGGAAAAAMLSDKASAKLVPPEKVSAAMTPGGGLAGAKASQLGGGALDKGVGGAVASKAAVGQKISDWQQGRMQKMAGKEAKKAGLVSKPRLMSSGELAQTAHKAQTLAAAEGLNYQKLSPKRQQEYWEKAAGGKIERQADGSYQLTPDDPTADYKPAQVVVPGTQDAVAPQAPPTPPAGGSGPNYAQIAAGGAVAGAAGAAASGAVHSARRSSGGGSQSSQAPPPPMRDDGGASSGAAMGGPPPPPPGAPSDQFFEAEEARDAARKNSEEQLAAQREMAEGVGRLGDEQRRTRHAVETQTRQATERDEKNASRPFRRD